jgi:hypothetical protein
MSKRILSLAVYALVLFCCVGNSTHAQFGSRQEIAGATRLENVRVEAQGIEAFFSDLSLSYDIPVGLEVASGENEFTKYDLEFKAGTLSELLTQFTARYSQYTWEIKDGVVNVFPKESHRDSLSRELLEVKVAKVTVNKGMSCWTLTQSLATSPEIKTILEANSTGFRSRNFTGAYIPQLGRDFKLDISDAPLKSILNKVIKESPTAKFWVITRNTDDRTVYFTLNARHEDLPPIKIAPILSQHNDR